MKYVNLLELNSIVSELKPAKEISLDSLMKLIELKKELKENTEKYFEYINELMKSFGVEQNKMNGSYDLNHLEQITIDEINNKVLELQKNEVTIKLNFLENNDFLSLVKVNELNFDIISLLHEFLVKK